MGEVYFRVSKHLGVSISDVIRHKFEMDYRLLIMKYNTIVRAEQKQLKEVELQNNKI